MSRAARELTLRDASSARSYSIRAVVTVDRQVHDDAEIGLARRYELLLLEHQRARKWVRERAAMCLEAGDVVARTWAKAGLAGAELDVPAEIALARRVL